MMAPARGWQAAPAAPVSACVADSRLAGCLVWHTRLLDHIKCVPLLVSRGQNASASEIPDSSCLPLASRVHARRPACLPPLTVEWLTSIPGIQQRKSCRPLCSQALARLNCRLGPSSAAVHAPIAPDFPPGWRAMDALHRMP